MIILNGNTEKLQVVLDGPVSTSQVQWTSSWAQLNSTDLDFYAEADGTSNDTTDVDVVTGVASRQLLIKGLTFYNADTLTALLTVKKDDAGVERIIYKATLAAGESANYSEKGWQKIDSTGAVAVAPFEEEATISLDAVVASLGAILDELTIIRNIIGA